MSLYNVQVAGLSPELNQVPFTFHFFIKNNGSIQLRESVHDFAQKELGQRAQEIDQSNTFPMVQLCTLH